MTLRDMIFGFLCALSSLACVPTPSYAQEATPLDSIPDGRRVPGWLLDGVGFSSRGQAPDIKHQFGLRGDSSISAPSTLTTFSGIGKFTAYYGRAFLRVEYPGTYTFIFMGDITRSTPYTSCSTALKIGSTDVIYANIYTKKVNPPAVGNINLKTGYYRIEYVISCESVDDAKYSIQIRGPDDAKAKYFSQNELFHVLK